MTRPIAPADLIRRQVVLEEHDPLPDGSGAVVVRRSVRGEAYRSRLHLVRFADGRRAAPLALTAGAVRDSRPRVSPDGRRVAFLRSFPDDPHRSTAVMVQALDGGEPWTLWAPEHGVSEMAWSPDGRRMAYVAAVPEARFVVGREAKGRVVTARRITRTDWRWDEVGHRDRWDAAWVGSVREGATPRRLTHQEADAKGIAWSPDGRWLVFAADPRPDADLRPLSSIWAIEADAGEGGRGVATRAEEPREVLRLAGYAGAPAISPDGRWIACSGVDVADPLDDEQPGVFVAPFAPEAGEPAPAAALAPDLDAPVGAWNDTDLNGWMVSSRPGPWWDGSNALVALVSERGRVRPWRFAVDTATGGPEGPPARLTDADMAAWTLGVAGGVVSVVATLDDRPMELLTVDGPGAACERAAAGRRPRPHDPRRSLASRDPLAGDAARRGPGEGGPIETWIVSPAGAGDRPLPAVVNVHGGPLGAWSPAPAIENVLLASRGYRVILPNVRGSAAYGRAWIRPQLGNWGGVDAADVLAAVDHVVGLGLADPARLGILGLSLRRLHGQLARRRGPGPLRRRRLRERRHEPGQRLGQLRLGPEYDRMALLGDVFSDEGVAKLWRQSPLRHVARIRTPLLMLQARVGPALPGRRQRAALHRPAPPRARGRVRPLPGVLAHLRNHRPPGPPDRPQRADARLVRPLPASGRVIAGGASRRLGPRSAQRLGTRVASLVGPAPC